MMVEVRVPASLAGLGPGLLDAGLALGLWDTFHVNPASSFSFTPYGPEAGEGDDELCRLFQLGSSLLARRIGNEAPRVAVRVSREIPAGRGLGARAAHLAAGALATSHLLQAGLDAKEVYQILCSAAPDPGPLAASLMGGVTFAYEGTSGPGVFRLDAPVGLIAAIAVPDVSAGVDPSLAPPQTVSTRAAAENAVRAALLATAFGATRFDLLAEATAGGVSHAHVKAAIPEVAAALDAAVAKGALGAFVSGWSAIAVALVRKGGGQIVGQEMRRSFEAHGMEVRGLVVPLSDTGAVSLDVSEAVG